MLNHIWIRKLCYFRIRTSHGAQKDDWKSNNMLIIIIIFIIMNLKHFSLVKCPLRGMLNVLHKLKLDQVQTTKGASLHKDWWPSCFSSFRLTNYEAKEEIFPLRFDWSKFTENMSWRRGGLLLWRVPLMQCCVFCVCDNDGSDWVSGECLIQRKARSLCFYFQAMCFCWLSQNPPQFAPSVKWCG